MELSETSLLLDNQNPSRSGKLSIVFAIICIVDVFGVFPVVALPKAIIDCGFYGALVIFVVCSVQIYTAVLLGKCWLIAEEVDSSLQKKHRYPYSALAEITYGHTLANLVSFLVDVTIFSGGIPNLIVASQNLQLLGLKLSSDTFDISFCYWIIALGMILCPVLWLGSPKDMKLVCSISVALVVLVFLLITGCLIYGPSHVQIDNKIDSFNPQLSLWELVFTAYGIVTFQFDIHPSILTIQVDMKEKSKLGLATVGGFVASLAMFSVVAVVAAIKFESLVKPSILETLPATIPLHLAAFFVAVQLCLSSVITNSALYQHVEDCMRISRAFNHRRCILRTTLTLFAVVIAESVPRFDLVMSLIGGSLTGPLVFIFPPLFYLKLLKMQKKTETHLATLESFGTIVSTVEEKPKLLVPSFRFYQKFEIWFCIIIIVSSTVSTTITTYVNVKSAVAFVQFSEPCIFNISSALIDS